jgi:hypothetical protein
MDRKSCFGTQLLDVADVYCRACEVFDACHAALGNADLSPDRDGGSSSFEQGAPDGRSPMQSSIEAAFSGGPAQRHAISQAPDPPPDHASDRSPPKALVHFSTRLPKGLDIDLKVYCVLHKMTVQTFIAEAIQDRLKK